MSFPYPQKLWGHIHQCQNFKLIGFITKDNAVDALEEICLTKRNNRELDKTLGWKLGMIV